MCMAAKNNEIFEEWQTMKITQDFLEVEGNQNANEKTESYLALVMAILVLSGEKFRVFANLKLEDLPMTDFCPCT